MGGPLNQWPESVAVDGRGNIAVAGHFVMAADFGAGPLLPKGAHTSDGMFLVLLDEAGKLVWNKGFADASVNQAASVVFDLTGRIVLAGFFNGGSLDLGAGVMSQAADDDLYVAQLDASGRPQWSKRFGGPANVRSAGVGTDAGGNIVVVGDVGPGAIDFGDGVRQGGGGRDAFVLRLDAWGHTVFSRRFGDAENQSALAVAVEAGGNAFVSGQFRGTIDLGLGPMTSAGEADGFIAKIDIAGQTQWAMRIGGAGSDGVRAVAVGTHGDVFVSGHVSGPASLGPGAPSSGGARDAFVAALDPHGRMLWSKRFREGGRNVLGIALDRDDGIVLSGLTDGTFDFKNGPRQTRRDRLVSVFATALTASGAPRWEAGYPDTLMVTGGGAAVDPRSGDVVLAGIVQRPTLDLGTGPLVGDDLQFDVLVVKLAR